MHVTLMWKLKQFIISRLTLLLRCREQGSNIYRIPDFGKNWFLVVQLQYPFFKILVHVILFI